VDQWLRIIDTLRRQVPWNTSCELFVKRGRAAEAPNRVEAMKVVLLATLIGRNSARAQDAKAETIDVAIVSPGRGAITVGRYSAAINLVRTAGVAAFGTDPLRQLDDGSFVFVIPIDSKKERHPELDDDRLRGLVGLGEWYQQQPRLVLSAVLDALVPDPDSKVRETDETKAVSELMKLGMGPCSYHEMSGLVGEYPSLRSEGSFALLGMMVTMVPAEYRTVGRYQLRWLREFVSTSSSNESLMPILTRSQTIAPFYQAVLAKIASLGHWVEEAELAMLSANGLEEMKIVAMHFPALLRPAIQAAIDGSINAEWSQNQWPTGIKSLYESQFEQLQQIREQEEGVPIESWWRPIERSVKMRSDT
jgi:hypothetical protein